ncbi:MAG: hypothetical protein GY711_29910 [bacterium]|nr:hypothetical protein [bacterium]
MRAPAFSRDGSQNYFLYDDEGHTKALRPADVALAGGASLTQLNEDLLGRRALASVEEIRVPSFEDRCLANRDYSDSRLVV